MGIASLILGIISLSMGWIPFICFIMFALAIVGLILGAVDVAKKSKIEGGKKGIGIAGLVISALAIPVIIISSIITIGVMVAVINEPELYNETYDNYELNEDYWQDYYRNILPDIRLNETNSI